MTSATGRIYQFAGVCIACVALTAGYALFGRGASATGSASASRVADRAELSQVAARPHLLYRTTELGADHGAVGMIPLDGLDGPRSVTPLSCERVYFAAGQGVCLSAERGMLTSYRGALFDSSYQTHHAFPLTGVPSRARMSRDGRIAALTYFVGGDSYASTGFSTRTLLVDVATGKIVANLEDFAVTRDGRPFKAVDFNFWGVTFTSDGGRFYATLSSGGTKHLIEGDVVMRTARVLRDNVECPSLSPDGRRIAFKRLMPGILLLWRIYVLDLDTGQQVASAESRSVDDQIEWLDDATLLYALPADAHKHGRATDIWSVPADGSGGPRLVLTGAESPAVVR